MCLEQEFNFYFPNISIYLNKNPYDFWYSGLFNIYPERAARQVFYKKIMSNKTSVKERSQVTNKQRILDG